MDPLKQREIASKGGKAAHQKGTAHEFTTEEARAAGRKGGAASRAKRSQQGESQSEAPPGMARGTNGHEAHSGEPQGGESTPSGEASE